CLDVLLWQTGRRPVSNVLAVFTQQQYRTKHAWRLRLDQQHEPFEDFTERRIRGQPLQNSTLFDKKLFFLVFSRRILNTRIEAWKRRRLVQIFHLIYS